MPRKPKAASPSPEVDMPTSELSDKLAKLANYDLQTLERVLLLLEPGSRDLPVRGAAGAAPHLAPLVAGFPVEKFAALLLDRKGRPLHSKVITTGSSCATVVDVAQILRYALSQADCVGAIVAHNHPSGDTSPSPEDVAVTRKLRSGFEAVGLKLLDHLIFGEEAKYCSLAEYGYF